MGVNFTKVYFYQIAFYQVIVPSHIILFSFCHNMLLRLVIFGIFEMK